MNGWESGVLEKAISENDGCTCGCGCGQEQMEQCFGSANVNKDDDKDWASCSASSPRDGDAAAVLDSLPGCNPLQYGPASATMATGPGCTAAPVAAPTSSNYSASVSAPSLSSLPLQAVLPTASYTALPIEAYSTFSVSLPKDQVAAPTGGYEAVKPTPTAAAALEVSSKVAPAHTSSSAKGASRPVVYKTITQTATITVGAKPTGGY